MDIDIAKLELILGVLSLVCEAAAVVGELVVVVEVDVEVEVVATVVIVVAVRGALAMWEWYRMTCLLEGRLE